MTNANNQMLVDDRKMNKEALIVASLEQIFVLEHVSPAPQRDAPGGQIGGDKENNHCKRIGNTKRHRQLPQILLGTERTALTAKDDAPHRVRDAGEQRSERLGEESTTGNVFLNEQFDNDEQRRHAMLEHDHGNLFARERREPLRHVGRHVNERTQRTKARNNCQRQTKCKESVPISTNEFGREERRDEESSPVLQSGKQEISALVRK